jgi:D-alanyl-D-alanine carboxypeptidase
VIWENTNKLLRRPNFIGGKTGVTVTAGPCLASCYELGEKILIVVLLRTSKLSRRFKDTRIIVGLALSKLDRNIYKDRIKEVLKNDA